MGESNINGHWEFQKWPGIIPCYVNVFMFMREVYQVERGAERKSRTVNPRKNRSKKYPELLDSLRKKSISYSAFLSVASPAMARLTKPRSEPPVLRPRKWMCTILHQSHICIWRENICRVDKRISIRHIRLCLNKTPINLKITNHVCEQNICYMDFVHI